MTPKEAKTLIDRAFLKLQRMSDPKQEASRLLEEAYDAASVGERHHREHAWVKTDRGYRSSVETAARYFVCKWYAEPASVKDALEATQLRKDCLYASALRISLGELPEEISAVIAIDYKNDLSDSDDTES